MLKLESLREVFLDELRDLLDAEHQLVAALPRLADKATTPELKAALHFHRTESAEQIARLEHVFESLGTAPERQPCKAMRGLLEGFPPAAVAVFDVSVEWGALGEGTGRLTRFHVGQG